GQSSWRSSPIARWSLPIAARCRWVGLEVALPRLSLSYGRHLSYVLELRRSPRFPMFPKPKPALTPNTYAYESEPLVKPTGFREYDARWLLGSEINLMGIQALGVGLGTLIRE